MADGYRLHRFLLTGELLITALALASFALVSTPMAWCGLAFLQGLGVASANTMANLFVVEVHPEDQWDGRIAWLQTFQLSLTIRTGEPVPDDLAPPLDKG
jgi:hypothetical protein